MEDLFEINRLQFIWQLIYYVVNIMLMITMRRLTVIAIVRVFIENELCNEFLQAGK